MRRVLPLLMLVTAAVLGACSSPAAAPPPRPPVAAQPVQVAVFLRQDVTASQEQAIADAMRAEPGASGVRFVRATEAFDQLKRVYRDQPEPADDAKPANLPASYQVTLASQTAAEAAAGRFRALPGVDQVRIGPVDPAAPAS